MMKRDSEEEEEEEEEMLKTPSPQTEKTNIFHETDAQTEFFGHRFYGPSSNSSNDPDINNKKKTNHHQIRSLHGLRRLDVSDGGPARFRSGSRPVVLPQNSVICEEADLGHFFQACFDSDDDCFQTKLSVDDDNRLRVRVVEVSAASAAKRAGVAVGDILVSVNDQPIESSMTEKEVDELIQSSNSTQGNNVFLFLRPQSKDVNLDPPVAPPPVRKSIFEIGASSISSVPLLGRLTSGSNRKQEEKVKMNEQIHEGSFCDGCGLNPIKGPLYTCSVCVDYNLCGTCYDHGTHGMENTEAMQLLQEALVQDKLMKECKKFTPEFLLSLRRDICKNRTDKFQYMGSWLANIIGNTSANKITVRGIEIPHLTPTARQRFVSMLMPLASNRTDIEVNIEWLREEGQEEKEEEKLRIWISDKKNRTKSPFT